MLQKNIDDSLNRDEGHSALVMSKVSTLCEDLVEDDEIPVELDDICDHPAPILKEKKTRQ